MRSEPRLAFVVDALPSIGGGEKTLFAALEVFPRADLFTLTYNREVFRGTPLADREVVTSFLDKLPFAHSNHRLLLPWMPYAIEQFDLRWYDVVVCFSYAVAHGVRVHHGTRHLAYTYTPMRYAWSDLNLNGARGRKHPLLELAMRRFRTWDRAAASAVHEFAAISYDVARRIRSAYGREARVIYPPVEVDRYSASSRRGNYFVTLSRLVPHKRLDLILEAFRELQYPLKIIGDGPHRKKLEKQAGANIEFLGFQDEQTVARLLGSARGFVCAAEEDFGIAMVEAQAAGCPVIAYGAGGALETVVDGTTGVLFEEQSAGSLVEAVKRFQDTAQCFRSGELREHARRFDKACFSTALQAFVSSSSEKAEIPAFDVKYPA